MNTAPVASAGEPLARQTLLNLSRYFIERNHSPSAAMWEALADLARTLEEMANGTAAPKFFLSSLDPGVGKTKTITHFVDCLLSGIVYQHVGVLICVARLSEIDSLVHAMAIPEDFLAVVTRSPEHNALGKAPVDRAQVLITTQQMIEKRINAGSFANATMFHYRGRPRAVRIWDESYLPGQPITLNSDDLAFILKLLTPLSPELRGSVKAIFNAVDDLPDQSVYDVPDFAAKHDIELNDALALIDNDRDNDKRTLRDDQRAILSALWFLSGKTVTVRKDGAMGNTVIDYRETLPDDLAPMVILDASGRVRDTYRDLEESRGTLVRLKAAQKLYDNLTIHLWRTSGGKQAFKSNGLELVAGIAKTIDAKPDEKWLVVIHRRDAKVGDVEGAVRKTTTTPQENITFITWGQHMATNDHANVPNVILAGTLFYRPSYYEALKRLAADRPATAGAISREELERVQVGEHAHAILQALCRGSVRKCDDEHCHPCDAYIIASVRSGIHDALPTIFPGCNIVDWRPIKRQLKGHVSATVAHLKHWLRTAKGGDTIPFRSIFKPLHMSSANFRQDVRMNFDFMDAIAELGIVEWGPGVRFNSFALAS